MKNLMLFLFSLAIIISSCNPDSDLLFQIVSESSENNEVTGETTDDIEEISTEEEIDHEGKLEINVTPCDFELDILSSGDTLLIGCQLDLKGKTINIPSDVTLEYDGGEIVNGVLNFASGGKIDGNLLNYKLEIKGTVSLQEDNFFFYPERWNIVQGETSDTKALSNKVNIRKAMDLVHALIGKVFEIDRMDAYFDVHIYLANPNYQAQESILLPDTDFHLKMSDNTYIRVQPNGAPAYNLITVYKANNIKITGGHLLGDRWEHDYSPVNDTEGRPRNSHGWGHVLKVQGGKNVLIEGVYLANSVGDIFGVHGTSLRNPDGSAGNSIVSENVTMRNCIIESARRNGMSILDGDNILIENCKIKDTGKGPVEDGNNFGTGGTSPRYGVSFEAYRERTSDGALLEYNKIENVTLRGNTFTGNYAGDVVLYTCSNITIEDNFFDSRIGNIAAHDVVIRNNTMKARKNDDGTPFNYAINLKSNINEWDGEFTYNYTISGNTIEGYGNAMILGGKNYKVFDNKFLDNKNGLGFDSIDSGEFYDNVFSSNIPYSIAYFSRGGILKDVSIMNEVIRVDYRPLNFRNIEASSNSPLKINNCELISLTNKKNFIENSNYITIEQNIINTDITVNNSQNIIIKNNTSE